jgi:hypothetical protein
MVEVMFPELTIDPEFRDLIPPPDPGELEQLRANLLADGCRDPLVVWGGILLDGHNRHAICVREGIPFRTVEHHFVDRDAAKEWVIRNQFGRRNLNAFQRAELALKLEPIVAAKAKENQRLSPGRGGGKGCQNSDNLSRIDTKKEIARVAGVSHDTIAKVKTVIEKAPEPVKERARHGEISVNAAHGAVVPPKPRVRKPSIPLVPPAGSAANGKSRVNGEIVDDPPDIAAQRAAGRIAPEVIPDVTEPDGEAEGPEPVSAREPGDDEPRTDEEWLEELPLRRILKDAQLKTFEADAMVYRHLEAARKTFQHHASRALKASRRRGEYGYRVSRFLKADHPKDWLACPSTENGGCGGTGQLELIGECPRCHGRGYWIR